MTTVPDPALVTPILRQVAEEAVLPRFRTLADGDKREKRPGDLVTIADLESEMLLAERLPPLLPGSLVVGEEGAEADPKVLDNLAGPHPVWILDPVDGTQNFADGVACFGVIVALAQAGHILAGWIHDPINDRTFHAVAGEGAWEGTRRLRLPTPTPTVAEMEGFVGPRFRRRLEARREQGEPGLPAPAVRHKCVATEYMAIAEGTTQFARYGGRLKPWDHAAGVLICREAGATVRLMGGDGEFLALAPRESALLLAPDEASWHAIEAILDA